MKMKALWSKSKWTYQELYNKKIEFKIPARGGIVEGVGKILLRRNPDGLMAIDLETNHKGESWAHRVFWRYHLSQEAVDRIDNHPNQSTADFILVIQTRN